MVSQKPALQLLSGQFRASRPLNPEILCSLVTGLVIAPIWVQETIESKAMNATSDTIKYRGFGCGYAEPILTSAPASLGECDFPVGVLASSGRPTVFNPA